MVPKNTKQEEKIYLRICGFKILITFSDVENETYRKLFTIDIKNMYKGFLTKDSSSMVDYHIQFVDHNRTLILKQGKNNFLFFYKKINQRCLHAYSHIGWIHLSIIFRNILSELLKGKGFIIHASSSLINNRANIFLGKSGAGKSTITQLLQPKYKILSDDCAVIKKEGSKFYLYQSPFFEKNKIYDISGKKYAIGAIYILKQSSIYRITPLHSVSKVSELFFDQLYIDDIYKNKDIHSVMRFLAQNRTFYSLHFAKDLNKAQRLFTE